MTKLIALYFPQLHPIPENDEWWGEGFTDWVNVKKAKSLFSNHYQPRIPLNNNYYNQACEKIVRWQINLAKEHGISGFCHYHYWFDGKQLLETPTNIFLKNKDIDFQFCLAWANETWSRRWDGQDHQVLQLQTHPPVVEKWARHFDYLIKAWTDERAIRVDGKPVFLIYRPHKIKEIGRMFDYWQTRAREHGIDGIYFVAINQYKFPEDSILKYFDAVMMFQPFVAAFELQDRARPLWQKLVLKVEKRLPNIVKESLAPIQSFVKKGKSLTIFDYDKVWETIVSSEKEPGIVVFPGAFVDWDNTARYGNRATIFKGANPAQFEFWLRKLVEQVSQYRKAEQLIFMNAWNEWAEGAYLEPDEKYKLAYLEAVKNVLLGLDKNVANIEVSM